MLLQEFLNVVLCPMAHKSGFVNIIGRPNAGKSTLMNALVGEQMAIVSHKAQTTRHRILGIVNQPGLQLVFSDTPGIIDPEYGLQQSMMRFVATALKDADVLIFLAALGTGPSSEEELLKQLKNVDVPLLVLLNKVDLGKQEQIEQQVSQWRKALPNALVAPISALHDFNVDMVFDKVVELLPEHPPYYDDDTLTDRPLRFFVAEIVRQKLLLNYHQEIPYSCEVVVNRFKEKDGLIKIQADIIVARDSQKGIIIGHQGKMLKKTGMQARKDLEGYLDRKVFLELQVKVDKNWRDKKDALKKYGYE